MAKNVTSADIFGGMFQNLPDYATKREEISENKEKKDFLTPFALHRNIQTARKTFIYGLFLYQNHRFASNEPGNQLATDHHSQAIHSFGSSSWRHSSSLSSTNPPSLSDSSLSKLSHSQPFCLPYPANILGLEKGFQPVTTVFMISLILCNCHRFGSS